MALLRSGDAGGARSQFQAMIDSGGATASAWFGLALAQRALGDEPAMHAAIDRALAIEPGELRALLLKSDSLASAGQIRQALTYYGYIVKLYPDASRYPEAIGREILRAHQAHAKLTKDVFARMQEGVATAGFRPGRSSSRFAQSLAMLSGEAKRYEQEPRSYYFPELPTIGFYDRAQFPWMDQVEAETDAIRGELQALLAGPNAFAPYIEAEENQPTDTSHPLLNSDQWTASYLIRNGEIMHDIADRCPHAMKAISAAPLEEIEGRAPYVLFSKLTPGAWIRPHTGFLNTRLVCHLPIIVPDGCWFRVGHEVRKWEEGKCFAFNDTIEHEARNEGQGVRTVLIFNIWRPELTEEERGLVAALMRSIDTL